MTLECDFLLKFQFHKGSIKTSWTLPSRYTT